MRSDRSAVPRQRAARLRPAERRAQLVASALAAFARLGLGSARPADVAAAARVSLPAVFHYFPTREALVSAVLDEVERFYLAMVTGAAAPRDRPARALLLELGRVFARSVDTHPDHARVWLDWSTAVDDRLWRRYFTLSQRNERIVAGLIRRGQRDGTMAGDVVAEDAARLYVNAGYAVIQMKVAGATDAKVERFLASAVRAVAGRPD